MAQNCTPDPQFTSPGIYPSTLPIVCAGQAYNETVTIVIPQDTLLIIPPGIQISVPFDSAVVNNVIGTPTGLSFSCNPVNCTFYNGSNITRGCINISGTAQTPGTYDIVVEASLWLTSLGAPASFVVRDTITLEILGPVGATSTTIASCGEDIGSASVNITSGLPPFTYLWNDPQAQTTATATDLAGGTYEVMVTDSAGCSSVFSTMVAATGPGASIDSVASVFGWAGCAEQDLGFIQPAVSGGTAPLTYSWTNGSTLDNLEDLAGGRYTLTVTDANGCTSMQEFVLNTPDVMTINASATDETGLDQSDGTATAAPTGGMAPYSYDWSNGASTPEVMDLPPGNYTVIVTDALGCIKEETVNVGEVSTSIDQQIRFVSDLIIAPNPAQGSFKVSVSLNQPQVVQMSLMDIHGRLIQQANMQNTLDARQTFTLSHSGIYFLQIIAGSDVLIRKVMVE